MAQKSKANSARKTRPEKPEGNHLPDSAPKRASNAKIRRGKSASKAGTSTSDTEAIPEAAISLLHSITNDATKAKKPKVGEASPDLGMTPLFPNQRDVASAERAYAKALELLKDEKKETGDLQWLQPKFLTIAQVYWVEHDRDARLTASDMKKEVTQLQKDLSKVVERLSGLPMATRQALNAAVRSSHPTQIGPGPNYVAELQKTSTLALDACKSISSLRNVRPRRSHRFERCAAELCVVRERITGKPVSQTIDLHERTSFATVDAAFIYAMMKAMDDKVTASQVEDGLRRAGKRKTKENSAHKSEEVFS